MAQPLTIGWAPVVLEGENVLSTLGPWTTVAGKHFFKFTLSEPGIRQLLGGYRSRYKAQVSKWPLSSTLEELVVEQSMVDPRAETSAVDGLFDEVGQGSTIKRRHVKGASLPSSRFDARLSRTCRRTT